jgi:maleate isomerase
MTRIGMIVPSSNTCLEPTTARILAHVDGVSVHFTRVPVTRIALDATADDQFATSTMLAAADLLADARVDVIAWNGTSGSWLGVSGDRALVAAVQARTGIPATTSTLALLEACAAFGARRVGMMTPYTADVAARIIERYAGLGLEVVSDEHLGIEDNEAFALVAESEVAERLRRAAEAGVDALAVVCTNVHGAAVAAEIEAKLGIPVLDSVSATLWHALLKAGTRNPIPGWGTLLASGTLRALFQQICAQLLAATNGDRVTLRMDLPELGIDVDHAVSEATAEGVARIRFDASIHQRAAATVRWVAEHRQVLVQPNLRGDPAPPAALVSSYGVAAQMLGPILAGGELTGWLSVHSMRERDWSASDRAAIEAAQVRVSELVEKGSG